MKVKFYPRGTPSLKTIRGFINEALRDIDEEEETLEEDVLSEQGCADRGGCVKKSDGGNVGTYGPSRTWYILNNKKGGVWRKGFESEKSAKDSIEAMHSQKESLNRNQKRKKSGKN